VEQAQRIEHGTCRHAAEFARSGKGYLAGRETLSSSTSDRGPAWHSCLAPSPFPREYGTVPGNEIAAQRARFRARVLERLQ